MSYMSNKWSWAFALLCAYIFSVMWKDLMNLSFVDAMKLLACLFACFLVMYLTEYSRTKENFSAIVIAFVFLVVLFPVRIDQPQVELRWKKYRQMH
jgi:uncharacterized membrane protein YjjP (DUF1212 family)